MSDEQRIHLRTPDELSPEERAEFERELDSGVTELPPNEIKGVLGEHGMDFRKVEDFSPDLNAGLSQENDMPIIWLVIVLAYFIFFPVAYWLLWRNPKIGRRTKVAASVVGAVGIAAVAFMIRG